MTELSITTLVERKVSGGTIIKYSNGILFFKPDPDTTTLNMNQIQEHYAVFMEIQNGKPGIFLSDNRNMKKMGSDEKVFIKNTFPDFAHSAALIVENGISKFLLNIFLHLHSPKLNIKGFYNPVEAIEWLLEQEKRYKVRST